VSPTIEALKRTKGEAVKNVFVICRPSLVVGLAVALSLSGQAAAQTRTKGSALIIEPGGVNLLQDAPASESAAIGMVTFVLRTQFDGALTVQLLGFVTAGSDGGGMLLSGSETGQFVTGTTMTSEALSLSFSAGAEIDGSQSSASNVRLLLAQYN
jgi:hypothetical protein